MENDLSLRKLNRKNRKWGLSLMNKKIRKSISMKKTIYLENNFSEPTILIDDIDEVNEKFEKFLDDMNIPDDKKSGLRDETLEKKCKMMNNSVFDKIRPTSYYIRLLNEILTSAPSEEEICKTLNAVRITLNSCPVSWIREFNSKKSDGLNLLLRVFNKIINSSSSSLVCLKCLRAFANCGYGFHKLMKNENAFVFIARCLQPENPPLMHFAVEILSIHTFYDANAHQTVLNALFKAGKLNNYINRFIPLIKGVEKINCVNEKDSLSLACIRFIDVIASPEFLNNDSLPLDEYYRLHLRREFVNYGLLQVYDQLLKNTNLKLTHDYIKRFLQEFETDEEDINEKSETVIRAFGDSNDLFRILNRSVMNTNCEVYLRSILSSLIIIRDDPLKDELFRFIDQVVAEIVLQDDNGFCPDPTLQRFDEISLRNLLVDDQVDDLKKKLDAEKLKKEECLMMLELSKTKEKDIILNEKMSDVLPDIIAPAPPPPPPPPPPPAPPPPPPTSISTKQSMRKSTNVLQQYGLTRKVFQPQNPMKKANWNKVNDKNINRKSFWLSINDDSISNDILIELENNFCNKVTQDKVDSSKSEVVSKNLKVLDMKTAQNISILLGSFRMDYDKLKEAILEINTAILTQSMIEQLIKNLPEPEQMQKICDLKDVYNDLSESEQFCYQLSSIKKLKPRLESILFQLKFDDKINEIKAQYHEAEMALTEILKSPGLKKILEIVLSLGNYMNAGSRNQQSIGFELGFLCKLSSTKDKSNTRTLLHFLADVIMVNFFHPNDLAKELSHIDKANRLALDATNSNLAEVKKELKALENQVKSFKPTDDKDKFFEKMEPFTKTVQEQITIAELFQTKMNEAFGSVAVYFCFNASTYKMEDVFNDIFKFKTEFLDAHKSNEEKKLLEERALKAKLEKERREKEKQAHVIPQTTNEEDSGVLDNLLLALKSGDGALAPKRRKPKAKEARRPVNRSRSRGEFSENLVSNLIEIAS